MSKNTLIIALGIIPLLIILSLVVIVLLQPKQDNDPGQPEPISITPTTQTTDAMDVIRNFFRLINDQQQEEALKLLSTNMNSDLDLTGDYLESFNTWKEVEILKISKAAPLEETFEPTYMVNFNLELKADTNDLIWQNGEHTRFITLALEEGSYRIISIATGP